MIYKCSDKKPENWTYVLAYVSTEGLWKCYEYTESDGWMCDDFDPDLITHWMDMPGAP